MEPAITLVNMILRDFQQNFQQIERDFQRLKSDVTDSMVTWMEGAIEQLPSRWSSQPGFRRWQPALERIVDQLRPSVRALRLRVTRLGLSQIEMILPAHRWVLDENRRIEEGVLASTAAQGFRLLWKRNTPPKTLNIAIEEFRVEISRPPISDLHVRAELNDLQRETILADLLNQKHAVHEMTFQFFDREEQVVATAVVKGRLVWVQSLGWK